MVRRNSKLCKEWIGLVLQRDFYKCQWCHSPDNLVAHHIKEWNDYPELRLDIDNGLTLCRACHMRHHKNHKGKSQVAWNKGIKTGIGGPKGKKFTEAHRLKLRIQKLGKKLSIEHRNKLKNCKSEKSILENRARFKNKTWVICKDTGKRIWINVNQGDHVEHK